MGSEAEGSRVVGELPSPPLYSCSPKFVIFFQKLTLCELPKPKIIMIFIVRDSRFSRIASLVPSLIIPHYFPNNFCKKSTFFLLKKYVFLGAKIASCGLVLASEIVFGYGIVCDILNSYDLYELLAKI